MRRGRFTEDQIIGVLREHEAGVKTADLCRKHGISDATFYNWKAKYGGLEADIYAPTSIGAAFILSQMASTVNGIAPCHSKHTIQRCRSCRGPHRP
jgi:hypothetical protein